MKAEEYTPLDPNDHHERIEGRSVKKSRFNTKTYVGLGVALGLIVIIGITLAIVLTNLPKSKDKKPNVPNGACEQGTPPLSVATSNAYASDIGKFILQSGGNAYDALVAVQFVLTVTEPYSSGIGGGAFVVGWSADHQKHFAFDGREEAPFNLTVRPPSSVGGAASGVPGTVDLLWNVYSTLGSGRMTWKELIDPAIQLAGGGWTLDSYGASQISNNRDKLSQFPASAALYLNPDLTPREAGSLMENPDLAQTLTLIAENGISEFYSGQIADDIVAAVQQSPVNPGVMQKTDLQNYKSVQRQPFSFQFGDATLFGMPMPSSSATVGLILNILSGFLPEFTSWPQATADEIAVVFNAMSLGYADRAAYMGDADFVDVPFAGLLDTQYATSRREQFLSGAYFDALNQVPAGTPPGSNTIPPQYHQYDSGTTHFSVADQFGNVVAVTSTIENTFGNGLTVPGRGFLLNNELSDFSDGGPNTAEGGWRLRRTALYPMNETMGGKRPLSSMSPFIIHQENKVVAVGSPGGWRIICTVLNTIINLLIYNYEPQQSIDAQRFATNNDGFWLLEESLLEPPLTQILSDRGFSDLRPQLSTSIGAVAIAQSFGGLTAFVDMRRNNSLALFCN